MLKNVRQSVFETNSSSMHSIAVKKNHKIIDKPDKYFILTKDGKKRVYRDLYYGRTPFECLSSMKEKALYLIAANAYREDIEDFIENEINPVFRKFYSNFTGFEFNEYHGKVKYGDVDQQSSSLLMEFLRKNNISIETFLTDSAYIVFIDGDEYHVLDNMIECGVVHMDDFEQIVTPYGNSVVKWMEG